MKVLITGITGFVGSNLRDYLVQSDATVIGVSRQVNTKLGIINYNNLSQEKYNNANAFIHLAGKAHDLKKTANEREYYEVNTDLTIKLFNAFINSNCKTFIFLSTVKAVADKVDGTLTESTIPNPKTAYGKSKLKAEQYILNNTPNNKNVYILRPCMIHGANNKGNLNLLYKLVSKGVPYPLGNYNNQRSFLSVKNLCFIIEALIKQQPYSNVFNVSDDDFISTKTLVCLIGESISKKAIIFNIPKIIINIIAKTGGHLRLPFNSESLQKLTENYTVSNSKIKEKLKIKLPLTTEEGLQITIKSFNKNENA